MNPSRDLFVGRQREMAALQATLADALAGRGCLVMLVGEPGIGKTRTAQELATFARQRGAHVLWGRCHESEGAPPYWPWLQILRTLVQQADAEALRAQMGAGAADVAEVLPQLRERLPDLKPPPQLEPEQARFRLFDSITTFFKRASEQQPLVLILDNLHWADASSLRLLEFFAQELLEASKTGGAERLLVVGTYRDVDVARGHPLYRVLGALSRLQSFRRVLMRGLSEEEVGQIIELEGGVRPSERLSAQVHRDTEGNPLFVGEVTRLLAEEGRLGSGDVDVLDFRLPEGVREVIGRRLDALPEECNEALRVASVIGREFSVQQLERFTDMGSDKLLDALDAAVGARIIEEMPRRVGRYQFSHALIRQTLEAELTTTRRVRLHARIVEAFEELYASELEAHADELARHAVEAEEVIGPEKLVRYSKMAGERALATYAFEEALAHFERALAGKEAEETDSEIAAILFGMGRAHSALSNAKEGLAALKRAFDFYYETQDVPHAVAVAQTQFVNREGMSGMIPLVTRALELLPPDSLKAGQLLANLGRMAGQDGDYEGAQKALDSALHIAQSNENSALLMQTLCFQASAANASLRYQVAREKAFQALELVPTVDDPLAEGYLRFVLGVYYSESGDRAREHENSLALLACAERLHDRLRLSTASMRVQLWAQVVGDWERACAFADQALRLLPDPKALAGRAVMEYELGNYEQGDVYLNRIVQLAKETSRFDQERLFAVGWAIPVACRISGRETRLELAESASQEILASAPSDMDRGGMRLGLSFIALQRRDLASAKALYPALLPTRGRLAAPLHAPVVADRVLGLLAHAIGQLDNAAEHFQDALNFCRRAGYRPELAWSCYDYANLLYEQGQRDRAAALLDEALSISTALGMKPLVERVTALKERIEAQPARAPQYPDGLTEREVEVLRLIAAGKSNRDIGEALFISLNTVARHVSNIFVKTNSANRAEAAAYAIRRNLISP